ncbi:MAG: YetF domain-containing protein, partial [Oscillospiraceae bacterium]
MFIGKAFLTALFSVIVLFLLTKLIGSKQISQMSMFDYVNGITIGSIAADLAIADETKEFIIVLIAVITYAVAGYAISIATIKSVKLRRFLSGKALILIENGNIYRKNLRKCKLDLNDVLTLARNQGFFNISE